MAIYYQEPLDRTFHALGDRTRRRILTMLARKGPASANELLAPFDVAQPTISRHLKVLETAGLIKRTVAGRTHRFEIVPHALLPVEDWITRHREFWRASLQRLERYAGGRSIGKK